MKCLYCDSHITVCPANGLCPNCGAVLPPDDAPVQQMQTLQAPHTVITPPPSGICCPKCRTYHVQVKKRGFGWIVAILGFLLLPPFGLLFGFIGQNKQVFTCHACSYRWKI